jgi:hypothetical protein
MINDAIALEPFQVYNKMVRRENIKQNQMGRHCDMDIEPREE